MRRCAARVGKMSILEAVHFADLMGLRTRAGKKLVNSSIYYILDNPFYYGEMKTKREIIKHVYPTLISQELWAQCQKQKALNNHNGAELKYSQKPFVLRGLITCGRTGRVCPCEDQLRRKYYSWVVCYTKTGQRRYIPEQDALSAIETVLNRIKIPDSLINPLYEEIKNAEISEKQYCQQEIGKLRQEQEKMKAKLICVWTESLTEKRLKPSVMKSNSKLTVWEGRLKPMKRREMPSLQRY